MEDKIERILNVTNYQDHPSNAAYKIFHFNKKEQANYFESLLKEQNIFFESDEDFARGGQMFLFAIKKTDLSQVKKINYLALGKYREPFVKSKAGRWAIVLFGLAVLLFAIISALMNQ